jgi:hypothetical protein
MALSDAERARWDRTIAEVKAVSEYWANKEDEPATRTIPVRFGIEVPDDGYDYALDLDGRLEHLADLMLEHPQVTSVTSAGRTGSGLA